MCTYEDWRNAPASIVAPLYDAECARWYGFLGWDYRPSCSLIESARVTGRLQGFLARDGCGDVLGWTHFLLHRDTLQIGNLVGNHDSVVRGLLRGIVNGPDARRARRLSCFLFPAVPAVESALADVGFSILHHGYLRRALFDDGRGTGDRPCPDGCDHRLQEWSTEAIPDLVGLLASAYEGTREVRCFAPDGEVEQWTTYLHHLVHTPACGRFDRRLSVAVQAPDGRFAGAIFVTALSDRTAHIAQMAVAVGHRGRGLGEWLVRVACERAREARYEQMTLLVAQSNQRARRLYDRLGFEPVAGFLFADRGSGAPAGRVAGGPQGPP
jgi:ribosomal protein S18 acetylase RimI-like enzyme